MVLAMSLLKYANLAQKFQQNSNGCSIGNIVLLMMEELSKLFITLEMKHLKSVLISIWILILKIRNTIFKQAQQEMNSACSIVIAHGMLLGEHIAMKRV